MKRFHWLLIAAALLVVPLAGEAQQIVTDTIVVDVIGSPTEATITAMFATPPRVGEQVIFRVEVVDEDSIPINAIVTFLVDDATILQLANPLNPQPGRYEATGTVLQKKQFSIWAVITPEIDEVRIASFRDGELNWTGYDTIPIGDSLQYCAWALNGDNLVVESPGAPRCPIIWTVPNDYRMAVPPDLQPRVRYMYALARRGVSELEFNRVIRTHVRNADASSLR